MFKKKMSVESWNIRLNFGTLSVGGCQNQPMLLFWKKIDKTQMSKSRECAATFSKKLKSIFVGHMGFQSVSNRVDTPCKDILSFFRKFIWNNSTDISIYFRVLVYNEAQF